MASSFNFTLIKELGDGNKIRIRQAAAPNSIEISVQIGAGAVQSVLLTSAESESIRVLLSYLSRSREVETA